MYRIRNNRNFNRLKHESQLVHNRVEIFFIENILKFGVKKVIFHEKLLNSFVSALRKK